MYKSRKVSSQMYWVFISLTTLFLLAPIGAMANEPVVGRYLQASGNTIRLQLTVRNPAPQNLILQQHLPPGTKVLSTSPRANKISPNDGVVKWLFKGVSPGKLVVVMQVQPPVSSGSISGTFRYRMQNGSMREGHIGR